MSDDRERYERLACQVMAAPDPVRAIASLIGDHEARLDRAFERIAHLEAKEQQRTLLERKRA